MSRALWETIADVRLSVEGREVRADPGKSTRVVSQEFLVYSDHSDYSPDQEGQLCVSMTPLEKKGAGLLCVSVDVSSCAVPLSRSSDCQALLAVILSLSY